VAKASRALLRDRLLGRMNEMGPTPDYSRLAAEVLGIRNATPALARRLVSQALVIEDRRDAWRQHGERICATAPIGPGVYVLRDDEGRALYVGKANNLRRRLRTHFSPRRWKVLDASLARAVDAEWDEVGSELEALLKEATLIRDLKPIVNVQVGPPASATRAVPAALRRDVIVVVPSRAEDAVHLVAARPDGEWLQQETRRDGSELRSHARRLFRFFHSPLRSREDPSPLAPIVYSWLARRGQTATRLDAHDSPTAADLEARLRALVADRSLFSERLELKWR
jgi:predicted GIY-YIG superfamily endonuclease